MIMSEKIKNNWIRSDGFNPSIKCDDPIVRKYTHKQYVVSVGDTEDDFVLDEKPVLIDEYNIQKRIQEEAKETDLKSLLSKLLLQNGEITGMEPELNVKKGFYGDITGVQKVIADKGAFVSPESIASALPEEFRDLSVEELASMTDQEIIDYVKSIREKKSHEGEPVVQSSVEEGKEGE